MRFQSPVQSLEVSLLWLNQSYGIIPIHQKDQVSTKAMFTAAVRMLRQKGYLGDAADFLDLGVDFHKADVVGIFPGVAFQ